MAHCLGGIVVKEVREPAAWPQEQTLLLNGSQALLQARLDPRYRSICDVTLGIIFFGTPHRGSEKVVYGKVLSNVAQTVTRRPSSNLLKSLRTNSNILLRLTSDFRHQLPQYHIVSFYEQQPMKMFSRPVRGSNFQ